MKTDVGEEECFFFQNWISVSQIPLKGKDLKINCEHKFERKEKKKSIILSSFWKTCMFAFSLSTPT